MLSASVCSAGWTVQDRKNLDSAGWTMVSPGQKIECDGVITQWKYLPKRAKAFRAIVWREVEGKTFKLVGLNRIPAAAETGKPVSYQVPADKQIPVQAGDMIGWSFGESVIAWNNGGGTEVQWMGGNLQTKLKPDQQRTFSGIGDREYSIKATVGGSGGLCSFEYSLHELNFVCKL